MGNVRALTNALWVGLMIVSGPLHSADLPNAGALPAVKIPAIGLVGTATDKLSDFPEAICNVQNLDSLTLSKHSFSQISPCIARLGRTLQYFEISDHQLQSVPDSIGDLAYLQILNLNTGTITTVSEQIGNLKRLVNLRLAKNKITSIPSRIGDMSALENLDLSDNQLTTLPDTLGQLTRLQTLILKNNKVSKTPTFLPFLINLKRLDLSGNPLPPAEQAVIKAIFSERGNPIEIIF